MRFEVLFVKILSTSGPRAPPAGPSGEAKRGLQPARGCDSQRAKMRQSRDIMTVRGLDLHQFKTTASFLPPD